jgi:hypothetical protein
MIVDRIFFHEYGRPTVLSRAIEPLHDLLTETELETLPLWLLSTYGDHLSVVDRGGRQELRTESLPLLGARSLVRRHFDRAAWFFGRLRGSSDRYAFLHAYALAMAGHRDRAAAAARDGERSLHQIPEQRVPWPWLIETFELAEHSPRETLVPAKAGKPGDT